MNKLRATRQKRGLRLVDLSRLSGLSIGTLWNIEQGLHQRASKETRSRLADALGEEEEKLFGGPS